MAKLLLLVAVTIALLATAAAQRYCGASYLTIRADGMAETAVDKPKACTTATVKTACMGGLNPRCVLSYRTYTYVCCFDIVATVATAAPGATLTTSAGEILVQNLKPICPNGALGFGGNRALPCNPSSANSGCPTPTYSCVKAVNVYDIFGTPAILTDDVGAALTPYVCCDTISLTKPSAVFTNAGLTPNIVPTAMAPTNGVVSIFLPTPAVNVYTGDDRSQMAAPQLTNLNATISLFTETAFANATDRYHALIFDSTTNKDCVFFGNVPGTGTTQLALPLLEQYGVAANSTADNVMVVVYTNDTTSAQASKPYMYADVAYGTAPVVFGPTNTDSHRFVVLVWHTNNPLNFGPGNATVADTTKILLGESTYGDFVPTVDRAAGPGKFTTVTAFLSGKAASILKTPIAGTYFFAKK
uniref:Uncharacterized protein n=1 Tax=Plectus sambesii TaxID=2011161 RepID=A0A914XMI9_9BILA